MGKYCTKCGKELTKGAGFCQNCGVKIELSQEPVIPAAPVPTQPVVQPQQTPPQTQPVPFKPPKKSKKKLFGIIGIIIILTVVVIASLFLFVLKGNDSTSTNTAETDIIGVWRMTYCTESPSFGPDDWNQNWIFNNDDTIQFEPPVSDGFEEYSISNDEICFTGHYYLDPRCYVYTFGSSKNSLTLKNDVLTMTFSRII
jgi:hypothetical protein